ncbi:ABC transporter substrate-binding protein [Mycoplasmopsis pulmonis]|uniref:ABC transporter substrate-binding protein n=1 Tax=Mycoplasmopsis pulmonis TaxID=2107 RepID=UPI0010051605|nr:ABC transporter substrate-binding protein [Mycoplasmopsis pulmonis]VEU67863.1 Uncharacterised protein [Mycoplasmopsis pulmonis]
MKRKIFRFLSLSLLTIAPVITFVSCAKEDEQVKKLVEEFKQDQSLSNLKTKFEGYSKDSMEIIGTKVEVDLQSDKLIKAFNEYFGTNLSFKQYGGSVNPGTILSSKFNAAGGVGNLLMFNSEPREAFESRYNSLIDTSAKNIIEHEGEVPGTISVKDKSFMPQVYEYYGVIYNKSLFNQKDIIVHEGKSIDASATKPANYDGLVEKDGKTHVYTSDLKETGYRKVVQLLKDKGVAKPFYSFAKGDSGTLWPISTHLMAAAVSTLSNPSKEDWNDSTKVITDEVIKAMKNALEIMGYTPENDGSQTNNVNSGNASLAANQSALIQGGTFTEPDIKRVNPTTEIGIFPLPIFNKVDGTAMVYRGAAQKWAITTLANDPAKLKTAKMFLQFLYKTKSGYNFFSKEFQFISPYGAPDGVEQALDPKGLLKSATNYQGATNVGHWVHDNFPEGFNTDNAVLKEMANKGYTQSDALERVQKAWSDLKTKK